LTFPRWDIRFGPILIHADVIEPFIMYNVRIATIDNPDICGIFPFKEYSYQASEFMYIMDSYDNITANKNSKGTKRNIMQYGPIHIKISEDQILAGFSYDDLFPITFDSDGDKEKFIYNLYLYDDNIVDMRSLDFIRNGISNFKISDDNALKIEQEMNDVEYRNMEYLVLVLFIFAVILYVL